MQGRTGDKDRWAEETVKGRKEEDARARRAGEGPDTEKLLRVSVVPNSPLPILRMSS